MADAEIKQLLEEVRTEHRLNRDFYEKQVGLMLSVIDRNADAFERSSKVIDDALNRFGDRLDAFGDKIDAFGEKIDAFGATLEIQREILLRFLARLDDGLPPQG